MKAVILAGGLGTRICEESHLRPKPMIEIGGKPLLWHIMKIFSTYGVTEFVICCGYKGHIIKEYFANYFMCAADLTYDIENNRMEILETHAEPWKVTLVDTGVETMTGGRLLRVKKYLDGQRFCLTYGDGVSDINISELIRFHDTAQRRATVTAVQPPGRFGALELDGDLIGSFVEKPKGDRRWSSGGFFVLESEVFDYLRDDADILEQGPLQKLSCEGQLAAYRHHGFWASMDTLRDKNYLEELWVSKRAPWKVW